MNTLFFITGIGTGVGKTLVSAIVAEALGADYWKPVQAGLEDGTDSNLVKELISNPHTQVHPELYRLQTPASPHIAARIDQLEIQSKAISQSMQKIIATIGNKPLVIEGAGGLLVPLSETLLTADLIKQLNARAILVSRNYLGSINHSLLTAAYCRSNGIDVAGWIFTDDYMQYETEIVQWSGYPSLGSVANLPVINKEIIHEQAMRIQPALLKMVNES
ncbi:MAG: dethiobiotin synthase [Bacteroidota bacterium]